MSAVAIANSVLKFRSNVLINTDLGVVPLRINTKNNTGVLIVESDPIVLDFDHVRGKKLGNIATLINECKAIQVIKDEIDKCEVVCANCHRRRTHHRRTVKQ